MKRITWSRQKARALSRDVTRRLVSFEDCIAALEDGGILDDIENPNSRYPHQRILVLEIKGYAYVVPYVESEDTIFLKTVFPSRKHTAIYLTGKKK